MQFDQIITGAAGFIGTHLCRRLADATGGTGIAALDLLCAHQNSWVQSPADIRSESMLFSLASEWSAPVVVHLAAMAEVIMPFKLMSDLTATNVQGTINVLTAFDPRRFVFASSSAVYGNVRNRKARPLADETAAIGVYGVSKVMGEVICTEWVGERGSSVVVLRFGNVVGPGCRGLIPYLVSHALKHPSGAVPAQLRGQGRIIRDYVNAECAVESILKAVDLPLEGGQNAIFNVGSGRALTNGEVAHIVADTLKARGYRLELNFNNPVPAGESECVVLDVSDTVQRLGVQPPAAEDVARCIEQATLWHVATMLQEKT